MAHTEINTPADNLLTSPNAQEHNEGIIWNIALDWKKELTNLRTDIQKWQLKKEFQEAKKIEQSILEYLRIDTYLGMDIPKKRRTHFRVAFSLSEEEINMQPYFYKNILRLYSLRHSKIPQTTIQSWITEKKEIILEFDVTKDKSSYFIGDISIENAKNENVE